MVTDLTVGFYWQRGPDNKHLTQKTGARGDIACPYTRPLASEGTVHTLGRLMGVSTARSRRADLASDMTSHNYEIRLPTFYDH